MKSIFRNKALRNWLWIPLFGGFSMAFLLDMSDIMSGDESLSEYLTSGLISFTFWTVLANGNSWTIDQIDKYYTWLEAPVKRALLGVVVMVAFTALSSALIIYLFITFIYQLDFWSLLRAGELNGSFTVPFIMTGILAMLGHTQAFLREWRQAAVDVERLKTENLKSKFETLKTQVNPHFLFNSLNALTNLVYADQDKAADFIQRLAEVYRYVIDHQNDEVVTVRDELAFLKSYLYLHQIRFGKNLETVFDGWEELTDDHVLPPVSLQMLVENAMKHNEISTEHPLVLEVNLRGDKVEVRNNRNPLDKPKTDSLGIGLENIRERFRMLTDTPVKLVQTDTHFSVQIPLLKVKS